MQHELMTKDIDVEEKVKRSQTSLEQNQSASSCATSSMVQVKSEEEQKKTQQLELGTSTGSSSSSRSFHSSQQLNAGDSWNRMRIHRQRQRSNTPSPLIMKATTITVHVDPSSSQEARVSPSNAISLVPTLSPLQSPLVGQNESHAVDTSCEKQRKLHRRASEEFDTNMSQLLQQQRQQQLKESQRNIIWNGGEEQPSNTGRPRLRKPFSRPSPTGSSTPLLAQPCQQQSTKMCTDKTSQKLTDPDQSSNDPSSNSKQSSIDYGYGDPLPPFKSPPKRRRKYSRRNSFLVKKDNPFSVAALSSSLDDDELIGGLIQQVIFGAAKSKPSQPEGEALLDKTTASLRNTTEQYSLQVRAGSEIHGNVKTRNTSYRAEAATTTDDNIKNSGEQECWVDGNTRACSRNHATDESHWANFSWSDSDDTKWYGMMSTLSFKSSGENNVAVAEGRTMANNKTISESKPVGVVNHRDIVTCEVDRAIDLSKRVTPLFDHTTMPPPKESSTLLLFESPTPTNECAVVESPSVSQNMSKASLVIDSLGTEESPRTPRLLNCKPGRKAICSDTDTDKKEKSSPTVL